MDHVKGRGLSTVPTFVWRIVDWIEDKKMKQRSKKMQTQLTTYRDSTGLRNEE